MYPFFDSILCNATLPVLCSPRFFFNRISRYFFILYEFNILWPCIYITFWLLWEIKIKIKTETKNSVSLIC